MTLAGGPLPVRLPRAAVRHSRAIYPDCNMLKPVRLVEGDHESQLTNRARVAPSDFAHDSCDSMRPFGCREAVAPESAHRVAQRRRGIRN